MEVLLDESTCCTLEMSSKILPSVSLYKTNYSRCSPDITTRTEIVDIVLLEPHGKNTECLEECKSEAPISEEEEEVEQGAFHISHTHTHTHTHTHQSRSLSQLPL